MDTLISVIVPIYNVRDYLIQCINSIQSQTYRNIEIVLVDDGSNDGSGGICDIFAGSDQRIKVIHQINQGVMAARRSGVENANGEYIGFVDGDDYIEPNMFEMLTNEILKTRSDFVHCGYWEEGAAVEPLRKEIINFSNNKIEFIKNAILGEKYYITPSIWSKLFRAELIRKSFSQIPDDCVFGEDLANLCICILECNKAVFLNRSYYHYRIRESSLSHKSHLEMMKRMVKLHDDLCKMLLPYDKGEKIKEVLDGYLWWNFLEHMEKASPSKFQIEKYYFPDPMKLYGKKVVIYGAGRVGRDYYAQISRYSSCTILAWIDSYPEKYQYPFIEVCGLEKLPVLKFDILVIAVRNEKSAYDIRKQLVGKGVSGLKIYWMNPGVYRLNRLCDV